MTKIDMPALDCAESPSSETSRALFRATLKNLQKRLLREFIDELTQADLEQNVHIKILFNTVINFKMV